MDYTKGQRQAIDTVDQNLQIIACAGSGKTQVVSARIVNILKARASRGVAPANIVAFTFTEKAASELKDRIHKLCLEELGTDKGLAEMFVGTIHGYCLNLLQSPPLYRYLKYSVLTDIQQRLFIDRHSTQSGLTGVPLLSGQGDLKRWLDSGLYQAVLGILAEGDVDWSKVPDRVKEAREQYVALCNQRGYLDYSMLLSQAVVMLKTEPALRERLAQQVKYLIVDEYQDVNPLQEALISEIHALGANLCVVGDDDQTIYQWRGSDIHGILHFINHYPSVRQVPLNENFRSSTGIVCAARRVVEANPDRLPKKMESAEAQPYQRGDVLALAFDDPDQEAAWIANQIRELHGTEYRDRLDSEPRGLSYSDFAILLRSVRRDGEPITRALDTAGIRYVVGGMNNLFDRSEIRAIRDVFFYLAGYCPKDSTEVTHDGIKSALEGAALGLTDSDIHNGIEFLSRTKSRIGNRTDASLFLQRVFLDFLGSISLREEAVDGANSEKARSGETVYFNLGKFSQVISDFEQVHFRSSPGELYASFAGFLDHQAPDYYPEGWTADDCAQPEAVQVITVHQAKGMQWPAVFVPCLRQNRFPSRRQGGRSVWHLIPEDCVANADGYKGTVEDERRLFYVALTRAERYLLCTWAPIPDNKQQRRVSQFFREFTADEHVLTIPPPVKARPVAPVRARRQDVTLGLTFSELKYYFACPYQFKLRVLYGFDAPISRALGYGKSLHDALVEIHSESIRGSIPDVSDVPRLVAEHLHLPFANDEVQTFLAETARQSLKRYLSEHSDELARLEHAEMVIELKLSDGVLVSGRIDLIRRTDTDEVAIVDFKSDERAQSQDISRRQLHIYAAGYQKLTGKSADLIEVHNLDEGGASREVIDVTLIASTMDAIVKAGQNLRSRNLERVTHWCNTCDQCEHSGICRDRAHP
jgi:DNA helicase-2/ATP-dependent DNA helicase PcrA